jgi:hypothetical protein
MRFKWPEAKSRKPVDGGGVNQLQNEICLSAHGLAGSEWDWNLENAPIHIRAFCPAMQPRASTCFESERERG